MIIDYVPNHLIEKVVEKFPITDWNAGELLSKLGITELTEGNLSLIKHHVIPEVTWG